MMRNAWHISGGEGAAQNTTCLRVLVTHLDESQTIDETSRKRFGIRRLEDMEGIRARLEKQRIKDIKEVQSVQLICSTGYTIQVKDYNIDCLYEGSTLVHLVRITKLFIATSNFSLTILNKMISHGISF